MRGFYTIIFLAFLCCLALPSCFSAGLESAPAAAQTTTLASVLTAPGDRVVCKIQNLDQWIPAVVSRDTYRIGPGDTLHISVTGRASLQYTARRDTAAQENPNEVVVGPAGDIYIYLAGKIPAAGKTIAELEQSIRLALSKYIRHFDVSVTVAKVRTVNVWVSGEVENPGPHILPAVSTVSLAALQAGIKPTGSTRRITLTRNGTKKTVDLYRMTISGDVSADIPLEAGDTVHVPAVNQYVEVRGEVTRPGRYELTPGGYDVRELISLAQGTLSSAAADRAFIERIGEQGRKFTVNVDLSALTSPVILEPGDALVVPSVEAFQPLIRLIGEFKGDGVYQRTPGTTATDIENKSGIYWLKRGQTVLDVISATGGVTPQADLKRARIERKVGSGLTIIPVDLERLLVQGDKSADVALENGDSLILPAVADRIHVFGEVKSPGSYVFAPNRRLVDYLGDAGGPTPRAKLTDIGIVRGDRDKPDVIRVDAKQAIRKGDTTGNPVLEPGDIVYVPPKFVSDWRDAVQLIFTALSLNNLLTR